LSSGRRRHTLARGSDPRRGTSTDLCLTRKAAPRFALARGLVR
jgi:hypothetical protein